MRAIHVANFNPDMKPKKLLQKLSYKWFAVQDLQLVGESNEGMGVMAYSILICDGEGMDQAQEQKSHLVQ